MTTKRYPKNGKYVLVLRACSPKRESRYGFEYPKSGFVSDSRWSPTPVCGNGLHGWLWGYGDHNLIPWYAVYDVRNRKLRSGAAKWLVIRVERREIINLDGKVKFPFGEVVHCGTKKTAGRYVEDRRPRGSREAAGVFFNDEIVPRKR